jgi:hypothetical protein
MGGGAYLLFFWPLRDPHPAVPAVHGALAIRDARIYASPDTPAIEHGTVLVRDGRRQARPSIRRTAFRII